MEAKCSSETSVITTPAHHIPETRILHSHRRENLGGDYEECRLLGSYAVWLL
jgi:hypothetical protein